MHADDMAMHEISRRQHGLVTREQLRDAGMLSGAIDRRVARGTLVPVQPGVYRHAAARPTIVARVLAAVLAMGCDALASHRSSLWLHKVWSAAPTAVELVTPRRHTRRLRQVTVFRTRQLDAADRTVVDGVPCTTLPRALLELGAVRPFDDVEQVFQRALLEGRTDIPAIVATLERLGRSGRNGTAALRACVHQSIPDDKLESELERRLLTLIRRSGLPEPELQHDVAGSAVRLDFAWPEARLAIEADGRRWHATAEAFRRDLGRSRTIQALGWRHHRYGWHDVVHDPDGVLAELRALRPAATSVVPSRFVVSQHR